MATKHVTQKYFLLHAKRITFRSLNFHLFFGRIVSESHLVSHNIRREKENKYLHRFIIYISFFFQCLLNNASELMSKFNLKLEHWLNDDKEENSEEYFSVLGHLDPRIELDKEIEPGDGRYYPALTMMASKLAYESEKVIKSVVSNHWKMEFKNFYDCYKVLSSVPQIFATQATKSTQAFMFQEKNPENEMIIVAFRGTSPFNADDWSTDLDLSWCKFKEMGKTHFGFMAALGLNRYSKTDNDPAGDCYGHWPYEVEQNAEFPLAYYTIREDIRKIMKTNKRAKFILTGHSLGGALAILFPAILALHGEREMLDRLEAIYTYGQPRVGDEKFGLFMKKTLSEHDIKYYRIVYAYDLVPSLPWDNTYKVLKFMLFKHFGTCIHFNSLYHGKIVEEERVEKKNEVQGSTLATCLWLLRDIAVFMRVFILARLNAVWELIRGFIIPHTLGPDFKEGRLQTGIRLMGIIFPRVADHGPQDYVNATRLASEDLFLH